MNRYLPLITALLLACPSAFSQQFADLAGEIRAPVPRGWQLMMTEPDDYPYTLMHDEHPVQVSIFKEIIEASDAVENEDQLRAVVDEIINSAILSLPDAQLLSNTGFYETDAVGFVIDFTSYDTTAMVTVQHRLHTVLYRAPDESQVMFTVWGKAPEAVYPAVADAIQFIQDELTYTGPHADYVFGDRPVQAWPYLLILAMIVAAIFLLARRRRRRM